MTDIADLPSSTDCRKKCSTHAATSPETNGIDENSNAGAQPSGQDRRKQDRRKRVRRKTGREPRISHTARQELDEFFEASPDALLTIENTALKLQVAPLVARRYLGVLVGEGELERVSFYRRKAKE